jgi:multidrug resistance efflux pump
VDKLCFIGAALLGTLVASTSCAPKPPPNSVSGTIETDEVRVASRYGGRVEKLYTIEGASLTNGQLIAELEASELKARRAQAQAQLAEWEAGPRKEEIQEAKNNCGALAAELDQAKTDANRAQELFASKTISPNEQEQAVTRVRTLEKQVEAAKSRYELLAAGTRPERIDAARAQLAEIESQLREMKVTAPSDCVVEVLNVKVGDVLSPNREIATLLLPQHIWVRVYVPEPWLGHISLEEKVNVKVDSDRNRDFPGVVEQIAREAEFTPRNVQTVGERIKQVFGIKVRLDNSEGKLRAGMAADVFFPGIEK